MFGDFLARLIQPEPPRLPQAEARLALIALLVRVARSDNEYSGAERDRIFRITQSRYGLESAAAAQLLEEAETLEGEAPDTVRFTRAIKDAVPLDERIGVIEAMWQIVMADGKRDEEENALMRLVASLLGITDQDSNAARLRVTPR